MKSLPRRKSPVALLAAAFSLLLLLAALPGASAAGAVEPAGFKTVRLWIYPEYDDPRLLVMMEGLIDGAPAPATVRFLVPQAAEMYSAGSMDAQGRYSGGPPRREPSDVPGWDQISYEVTTDTFRVEYYDPSIRGGPDKTISFDFRPLYPISGLRVFIQEPLKASNYVVTPASDSASPIEGFKTHTYSYGRLEKDATLHFDISYTKSDPNPSIGSQQGTGQTDGGGSTASTAAIAIGLAVILATVVVWAARRSGQRRRRPAPRGNAASKPGGKAPAQRTGGARPRFCHQCGSRLQGSGRFCPACGSEQ